MLFSLSFYFFLHAAGLYYLGFKVCAFVVNTQHSIYRERSINVSVISRGRQGLIWLEHVTCLVAAGTEGTVLILTSALLSAPNGI